jgi:hypothetical protein
MRSNTPSSASCSPRKGGHRSGLKHFRHPAAGLLDLMFEAMALEADEGLTLTACTAEPGTPSRDGLKLPASWAATHQAEDSQADRSVVP